MTAAEFRRRLRALRRARGLSQPDVARLLGINWQSVARWEQGRSAPPAEAEAPLTREAVIDRLENFAQKI